MIIIVSIVTIQIRMVTALIPPSSSVVYSTVITFLLVIIPILGSKSHTVMIGKFINSVPRIEINKQCVVSCLVSNCKITIKGQSEE